MATRSVWARRYAVFDEIASGGMASVYLACRLGAGDGPRAVAIKKLFESYAKQPEFVTMFLDEAHIAARIRHPNVVTTYEFLRIPDSLGIVMEFVLGVSLENVQHIARDRGVIAPLAVTGAILRDTLRGLHAAHEATDEHENPFGLVHRDVSPHNIILGKEGVARVIDFGIAKAAGRLQVTDAGVMKGKFAYMAPEQIRAEALDRRVDLYAAGIVLWEGLTGSPLFRGSGDATLFSKRAAGQVTVPDPSTINDTLPSGLDDVVRRALSSSAEGRFATAEEMAQALESVLPMASPQEVSVWIHGLAGSRIRELEAKRNEVETAYASGELAELGDVSSPASRVSTSDVTGSSSPRATSVPSFATDATVRHEARAGSAPALPELELDLPFAGAKSSSKPVSAQAPTPKVAAPRAQQSSKPSLPAMGAPSADDVFGGGDLPDMKLDLADGSLAPAPSVTSTRRSAESLDARRPSYASTSREPRRERSGGGGKAILLLVLFLGIAAGSAFQFGPGLAKTQVIAGARKRGLVLGVGTVDVRNGGLTLNDVTLSLPGVPEVAIKASLVDLDLSIQGEVRKVAVPGYEITVKGAASALAGHFASWRALPHAPLVFEAKSGHLTWQDLLVPGLQLEGLDVTTTFGSMDEGSVVVDASSLSLTTPRGQLGPWGAHLESTSAETKLVVELDRSQPQGPPNVSFVSRPGLGLLVSATIPRTKVMRIGVSPELFHGAPEPELDLGLEAQVMPTGSPVTAHGTVGMFGIAAGGAAAPAGVPSIDLVLAATIGGDPAKPVRIDPGTLTLGKVSTKITGTVTFEPDGLRVDVERPAGKAAPVSSWFVFDTRDWTSGHAETAPKKPASASPPAASGSRRH